MEPPNPWVLVEENVSVQGVSVQLNSPTKAIKGCPSMRTLIPSPHLSWAVGHDMTAFLQVAFQLIRGVPNSCFDADTNWGADTTCHWAAKAEVFRSARNVPVRDGGPEAMASLAWGKLSSFKVFSYQRVPYRVST